MSSNETGGRVFLDSSRAPAVGCAPLLGAATAASQSLSSAIQQLRDMQMPGHLKPNQAVFLAREFPDANRIDSFQKSLNKKLNRLIEEKKEDPVICNYNYTKVETEPIVTKEYAFENPQYTTSISSTSEQNTDTENSSERMFGVVRPPPPKVTPPRTPNGKGRNNAINSPPPMARMRGRSADEPGQDDPATTPKKPVKTPEEVKAEKQRKWKTKMRIAQEQKRKERRALHGRKSARVNHPTTLAGFIGSQVLNLIDKCGAVDDVVSDSEESMVDEDTQEDTSRGSASSPGFPGAKSKPQGRKLVDSLKKDSHGRSAPQTRKAVPVRAQDSDLSEASTSGDASPKQSRSLSPTSTGAEGNIGLPVDAMRSPLSNNTAEAQFVRGGDEVFNLARLPHKAHGPANAPTEVSYASSANMDPKDSNFVKAFVQDMVHIGFSFLWHKEVMSMNSSSVVLTMQPGYRTTNGTYCAPQLVWQESEYENYGIDLFDIQILERANPVQLKYYPYAIPSRTVYLRTKSEHEIVYEAPSESDAFRFVQGMKLLVARLTFNLVIGNMDVVFELLDVRTSESAPLNKVGIASVEFPRHATAMDDMADQLLEQSIGDVDWQR